MLAAMTMKIALRNRRRGRAAEKEAAALFAGKAAIALTGSPVDVDGGHWQAQVKSLTWARVPRWLKKALVQLDAMQVHPVTSPSRYIFLRLGGQGSSSPRWLVIETAEQTLQDHGPGAYQE